SLEPGFPSLNIRAVKLFVAHRKVNDTFNKRHDKNYRIEGTSNPAGNDGEQRQDNERGKQERNTFTGIAKVELVDAQSTQNNGENPCGQFLFGAVIGISVLWIGIIVAVGFHVFLFKINNNIEILHKYLRVVPIYSNI